MPHFSEELEQCTGFDWDDGNLDKNWALHQVSTAEAEETFFNQPFVVAPDARHSQRERRFAALGSTSRGRRLTIVFTLRGTLVRVISARDMSRRERSLYEKASQETQDRDA
ncbi:MAG: BrnT family toxin [Deltaproteobacteria bacterium]